MSRPTWLVTIIRQTFSGRFTLARKLDEPSQSVLLLTVAEHFVKAAKHRWLMNECICRPASHIMLSS